jgi:hypothetical protein
VRGFRSLWDQVAPPVSTGCPPQPAALKGAYCGRAAGDANNLRTVLTARRRSAFVTRSFTARPALGQKADPFVATIMNAFLFIYVTT